MNPDEAPVKHTALGRFKHEGANVIVGKTGHVVAYMGDDERFDYLYKFVSTGTFQKGASAKARQSNKQLLTAGNLYVARFTGDSPLSEITGTGALPSDGAVRRHRRVAPARGRRRQPGARLHRRAGARQHPPGSGCRRRDQDGPLRGRRTAPDHRPRVRRLHEQHRPRRGRQGRRHRGQPARVQPRRAHRRDHRGGQRRDRDQLRVEPSAGVRRPRRQRLDLLRRLPRRQGVADLLPRQRRVRLRRQPLDLHRRRTRAPSATATACSRCRSRVPSADACSSSSPCRASPRRADP